LSSIANRQSSNQRRRRHGSFRQFKPDITLLNLRLQDVDGLNVLTTLRAQARDPKVVILTTWDSDVDIQRAFRGGAFPYMLKSMPCEEILATIGSVHRNGKSISPEIAIKLAQQFSDERLIAKGT
jgi:two-component system NarL family response regulator